MPSPNDCATLQAIHDGVDHVRSEHDREWGFGRLALLVSDDLRAKLYRQKVRWSEAYQAAWAADHLTRDQLAAVEAAAGGMKRAYPALAAAATEAGHRPIAPWVWEHPLPDGTVAAMVQTDAEVAKVLADGRYVVVYTMAEFANVVGTLIPESLQAAKIHFPGARFTGTGDKSWDVDKSWVRHGDEIPFGNPRSNPEAA